MFCKNCGKEIEEDVKFCPECGTNQSKSGSLNIQEDKEFDTNGSEKPLNDANSAQTNKENIEDKQDDSIKLAIDEIGKTNTLCVASLVLVILMFFFNYYGVVSYVALILAILGFRAVKRNGERGLMISVVCIAVSGVESLITIMQIVEYNRYMAASYGEINALVQWMGNLF